MDSSGMDQNGNNSDDMSSEPSVSLNKYTKGVYGEPVKSPRIGTQYQVEIPALMSISQYRSYRRDPFDEENKGGPSNFVMGLPISIIWVNQEVRPGKNRKVEFLIDSKRSTGSEHNVKDKKDEIKGFLVPGLSCDSWCETEKASFMLGLYIFGKNFVKVKNFVETKKMGEILFCYYGKFYQTFEKRRWLGCLKGKTRKCGLGEILFDGLRQQELLSRLAQGIPEELQNDLMQVSRIFNDKKIELEDYVFSLKILVGMTTLFEAVGIGRGRHDLTGASIPICREVPIGKDCSSLSPEEIIKILTGDHRLSKARSTDLFWEAVWPILVNKGWTKTWSSSHNFASCSKQSHVYLVPGVPKSSSRRELVKGEHYFDSVVDVLNLIASNPGILDLDKKEDEEKEKDLPEEVSRKLTSLSHSGEDNENVKKLTRSRSENVKRKDLEAETSSDHGNGSKNPNVGNAHIAPVAKRPRRLTACNQEASGQGLVNLTDPSSDTLEKRENVRSSQVKLSATNSLASSMESFEERAQVNEPNDQPLFDLNLPAEEVDYDYVDFDCVDFMAEVADPQNAPTEHAEPMAGAEPVNTEEEQVSLNSRRQLKK